MSDNQAKTPKICSIVYKSVPTVMGNILIATKALDSNNNEIVPITHGVNTPSKPVYN